MTTTNNHVVFTSTEIYSNPKIDFEESFSKPNRYASRAASIFVCVIIPSNWVLF